MDDKSLAFLEKLLNTPGPSGFETAAARVWRTEAEGFSEEVSADVKGNSQAVINPNGSPRVMLAGHIDEIGLMIVHVDDDGFLFFATIGGWDSQVLVGQRVTIAAADGPVSGVIGKKAVHLIKKEDRSKATKVTDLWIDIGARSKDDALARVRIGDPAVLNASMERFPSGRIASRSIDNRIGAFIVLEALRLLASDPPRAAVYAVATAQEEISWTGGGARTSATSLEPSVALVVDVTHATDHPDVEKKEFGDYRLGAGPVLSRGSAVNEAVFDLLVKTAEEEKIPYAVAAAPGYTGTDADSIHTANRGIATGLVSVPNRYMHSPNEMADLDDLDNGAKLLAGFARRVTTTTDFTPR